MVSRDAIQRPKLARRFWLQGVRAEQWMDLDGIGWILPRFITFASSCYSQRGFGFQATSLFSAGVHLPLQLRRLACSARKAAVSLPCTFLSCGPNVSRGATLDHQWLRVCFGSGCCKRPKVCHEPLSCVILYCFEEQSVGFLKRAAHQCYFRDVTAGGK